MRIGNFPPVQRPNVSRNLLAATVTAGETALVAREGVAGGSRWDSDDKPVPDDVPSFDEFVDLLRVRLGLYDGQYPSNAHSFKEVMADYGDVIPQVWWHDAYDELEACGHLDPASSKVMGDAHARLSADGRVYLRSASDG